MNLVRLCVDGLLVSSRHHPSPTELHAALERAFREVGMRVYEKEGLLTEFILREENVEE